MTTIKETAQAYVPPQQTKNIAELSKVSIEANITPIEKEFRNESGKTEKKTLNYARIDGEIYYVPVSVLRELKTLLLDEQTKTMTHFRVIRSGKGMETEYKVVPLGVTL